MKKVLVRGLRDVRTHGSRCGGPRPRHEVMMSITTLEMEKTRRQTELSALRDRVASLERRLAEIDAECARLHGALAPTPAPASPTTPFLLRY